MEGFACASGSLHTRYHQCSELYDHREPSFIIMRHSHGVIRARFQVLDLYIKSLASPEASLLYQPSSIPPDSPRHSFFSILDSSLALTRNRSDQEYIPSTMVVILAAVSVAIDGGTTQGQGSSSASGSSSAVKTESSPAPAPSPPPPSTSSS